MTLKPIIYPYKMASQSAKALAQALETKRVYPGGRYKPKAQHVVVNWGSSIVPNWIEHYLCGDSLLDFLNSPWTVQKASNKLLAFQALQGKVSIPEWTTDRERALLSMLKNNPEQWVIRNTLTGHSGAGIELWSANDGLTIEDHFPIAPLYVKYIKKSAEYRVHVFCGRVIDIQQKRKRQETPNEEVNYQIRNYANGWVYCRDNITVDDSVYSNSIAAVAALGLDFGAVDVIWNSHEARAYVLEVNTAPGLQGTTLTKYIEAINEVCNNGHFES